MRLADHLKETGTTHAAFGRRIGRSQVTVSRYAAGRVPEDDATIAQITRETQGATTLLDWYPEAAEALRAFHPHSFTQAAE